VATATPAPTTLAVELTTTDLWLLVAIGVLLICSLLLAVAETALVRVPRPRAEDLAAERRKGADALVELLSRPEQFVTTVVFLLLGCQLVQATLVGIVADRMLGVVGLILATAVNVVVVFVVAETAPKTWAVLNPERAALAAAGPVRRLALFPPLRLATRALIGLANLVLPGRGLQQGPFVSSEEELLAMAEASVEEGVIEEDERALIESIIEFGDTVVREVMVPRPDMVTVPAGFRVADVMEVLLLNGYSRLPVCSGTLDDVVGLAYAKDLMAAERDGNGDAPVSSQMRPARFVPETKRVPEMLREMQRDKFHMAIVVDEYGGTAGLVTLEDIIEELVGEIVDEFDVDDPLVEPLPGGGIRVHARTSLDEVNDLLHTRFPEGDWDTIGGLLYDRIGHAPTEGESVTIGGWRLTAQRIQGRRIGRVRITPDSPAPPSPGPPVPGSSASPPSKPSPPGSSASPPSKPSPPGSSASPPSEPSPPGSSAPGVPLSASPGSDPPEPQSSDSAAPGSGPPGAARPEAPSPESPPGRSPAGPSTSSPQAPGADAVGQDGLPTSPGRTRRGGDAGQVAGIEAIPFGILIFVVGALLIANVWAVVDAKSAVDAAAREATRRYVESQVDGTTSSDAASDAAVDAGLAALAARGRDPSQATVELTALEGVGGQSGFTRCARATFTAEYQVPALTIPWIGGYGSGFTVTSRHSELVDPFRGGVPGSAEGCS
jgi:CBS domain containing-hemolysin-like protein